MCDTLIITAAHTKDGKTLFAKNSDRDPDEVQNIVFLKGDVYPNFETESVQCTYISVPQVAETYDTILSQPFWMWGGEMGINQHGLVIGNEAVFTTEPLAKEGLLGMDMIRLALQRKSNAKSALEFIIWLLETYGQGGGAGYHDRKMSYHNSWIIGDSHDAFVLETAGRHWVWKKIEDHYSISNILTIESDFDGISNGTIEYAIKNGRCQSKDDFSFKECFIARGINKTAILSKGAKGNLRRRLHHNKACELVDNSNAKVSDMMKILRSHQPTKKNLPYEPGKFGSNADVCWHAASFTRPSQSTSSFIAEIGKNFSTIWTTCGSAPCIQLFRPLFLFKEQKNEFPEIIHKGSEFYDDEAIWWKNELLHRLVLKDYKTRLPLYSKERDDVELKWLARIKETINEPDQSFEEMSSKLNKMSATRFGIANQLVNNWIELVQKEPVKNKGKSGFNKYWDKLNKKNQMPID